MTEGRVRTIKSDTLREAVIPIVCDLLPTYERNRQLFPLWTYDRDAWDALSEPWRERLHFSPMHTLDESSTFNLPRDTSHIDRYLAEGKLTSEQVSQLKRISHRGFDPKIFRYHKTTFDEYSRAPLPLVARSQGLVASTQREIPIEFKEVFGLVDPFGEYSAAVTAEIKRLVPGAKVDPDALGHAISYLNAFDEIRRSKEYRKDWQKKRDMDMIGPEDKLVADFLAAIGIKEGPTRFLSFDIPQAKKLLRDLGLITDARAYSTLSADTILHLDDEARGIIKLAREEAPSEDEIESLRQLIEQDPQIQATTKLEISLAKRRRGASLRRDAIDHWMWYLRYPFLYWSEVTSLDDDTVSHRAFKLVTSRLGVIYNPGTYANILTDARSE